MAKTRQTAPSGRHLSLAQPPRGDNAPQPIRTLRDWLDRLAAQDRLTIARPGVDLRFELAAIAKRLDGRRATLFPRPGGHRVPVVSGLVSDRQWIANAMGVEPGELLAAVQDGALDPVPCRQLGAAPAPAQEAVRRAGHRARRLPFAVPNQQ